MTFHIYMSAAKRKYVVVIISCPVYLLIYMLVYPNRSICCGM